MLETVNLDQKLSQETFKKQIPALQRRLYDLEKACWDNRIPSILLFEGWDAAGKGGAISTLTQRLDPRGFKLYSIQAPRTYEQNRPWLWRFWQKAPSHGEMVIFDHSWYYRPLVERVEKLLPPKAWRQAFQDIAEFERMLADDGCVIVKFFLHISKKEQKKRFRAIEKDPLEAWRVTAEDWRRHKKYGDYLEAVEETLELTESEYAPWTIVEATSRWYARRKIFDVTIASLEKRLGGKAPPVERPGLDHTKDSELREMMESLEGGEEEGG